MKLKNWYAFQLVWKLCPVRLLLAGVKTFFDFGGWVFYTAVFPRYLVGALEMGQSFWEIIWFVLLSGGIFFVIELYQSWFHRSYCPVSDVQVYQKLYTELYRKAKNVELMCYEDSEFYSRYTKAITDAAQRLVSAAEIAFRIIVGVISAGYVFSLMFSIDRWAVLFLLSPLLGYFLFGMKNSKLIFQRDRENVHAVKVKEYVNRVIYLPQYAKELRMFGIFRLMQKKYRSAAEESIGIYKRYTSRMAVPGFMTAWLGNTIIYEGVALYAAYRCMVLKNMDLATLAVMTSIMVTGAHMIRQLAEAVRDANENNLFMQNLKEFLEYKEAIPEDGDGLLPPETIETITFQDVSFAYPNQAPCLKHLNFTVTGGSTTALVGHNGAGKSTLIKLLFRFYDPTEGRILLNGTDIRAFCLREYRKLFSAAFQDYTVFAMSVLDNVLMGESEDREAAFEALEKSGISETVCAMPQGIDSVLTREFDEQGQVLSGGQQQKIVVARAFAKNAPVCVFDEPSAALDPIAEYELYQNILEQSAGKTLIFISHRLSAVKNATNVYLLEDGEIKERGTHASLMELGGAYAELYRIQAKNYLADEEAAE